MLSIGDRFRAVMRDGDVSKGLPIMEWAGWWDLTLRNWYEQGLPKGANPAEWFGLDAHHQIWFGPKARTCPSPASHGAAIVCDATDYERIRPHLFPEPHFDPATMASLRERQEQGGLLWLTLEGPFWFPRTLLGIQGHLLAFYDEPDLMLRMNRDLADHCIRVIEAMCEHYTPEFMTFAEDMSYNHGPMISYGLMDEFMAPFYQTVIPELVKRGITPLIDSDGDIEPIIPWFEAAGIEGILPLERMAGVDVSRIRRNHPKWKMVGGFDKTVMHLGEQAIRQEFERIKPAVLGGFYVPSCDHQTPPAVSVDDYHLYVRLLKEFSETVAKETKERIAQNAGGVAHGIEQEHSGSL